MRTRTQNEAVSAGFHDPDVPVLWRERRKTGRPRGVRPILFLHFPGITGWIFPGAKEALSILRLGWRQLGSEAGEQGRKTGIQGGEEIPGNRDVPPGATGIHVVQGGWIFIGEGVG